MAVAGQKRQGDFYPISSACKRQAQVLDWASLPPDIAVFIAELLLAEDVVDYMSFRAVCAPWRASTPSPRDTTLRDVRFRPRRWVALCDGDGVRPADASEITFFNTSTGRCLRVRLPELQLHRIVGFTDGLVILLNKSSSVLRVIHPFTCIFLDQPPLAPIFRDFVKNTYSMAWMNAAVCLSSDTSIAVVIWFPNAPGVICSEPGQMWWTVIHECLELSTSLPFEGKLFGVNKGSRNLIQVYPPSLQQCVVAQISIEFELLDSCCFNLVECQGQMLLAVRIPRTDDCSSERWRSFTLALFGTNMSNGKLTQVNSLRNHALFLGQDRCISIFVKDFPSICGESIYLSRPTRAPTLLHTLSNGRFEQISRSSFISDSEVKKLHSIRPFTLVDQLLTYCNHAEWSRGFIFHEFYANPMPWENFLMFSAQDKFDLHSCLNMK